LPGTAGGSAPFFSPDGRWIGFSSSGAIKKVSSDGGPPVTLCEAPSITGAFWGDDGFIYFAPSGVAEIRRVPEEGGTPKVVAQAGSGETVASFGWPQSLPGGKTVLFTTASASYLAQHYRTEAYSLATGKPNGGDGRRRQRTVSRPRLPCVHARRRIDGSALLMRRASRSLGRRLPLIEGVTRTYGLAQPTTRCRPRAR